MDMSRGRIEALGDDQRRSKGSDTIELTIELGRCAPRPQASLLQWCLTPLIPFDPFFLKIKAAFPG